MARINPRQAAAYESAKQRAFAKDIEKDVRRKLARGVQEFAIRSMNGLAEAGPAWTGEFSQSWVFTTEGGSAQSQTAGGRVGIGKYNRNDVPVRQVEQYLKQGKSRFQLVNTSEHAAIAIDAEAAKFAPPADQLDPIKVPVEYGTGRPSNEHLRWQLRNEGGQDITSQITAEQDWFANYVKGGQLQRDLSDGVRIGFSENVS